MTRTFDMATVTALPSGARPEHRGLSFWMDRVIKELEHVRSTPDADAVHDLRVAIRRCRSVAAVMEEVDPDPAWTAMRKIARKLFRGLGALRDAQVMDEWVKRLAPETDPVRSHLQASFESSAPNLRENALRVAAKFDQKSWKRLERTLGHRSRLVPVGSLAAECLALERFENVKELHAKALRTEKPKPWHALRIGLKRFRYTIESLLPEHYNSWSDNLKRVQDILGEIHDLDVLAELVRKSDYLETEDSLKLWQEIIESERHERIETYRQLTLGKTSLWNIWRSGLPTNGRIEAAALARLRATARAVDPHVRRTSQVSRVAVALFDALKRADCAPAFSDASLRRILLAAARLHGVGDAHAEKSPQKAARRFLLDLTLPPGWNNEEWELLALAVRYHRGTEPHEEDGPFSELSAERQKSVRALAGVLRLARALRKCGAANGAGIRAEKSTDAIVLRVPGLTDDVETASRLAAGKHLLEEYLGTPLIVKAAVKPEKVVALTPRPAPEISLLASD
ncbi:MAG TPA: CHAD domain-containing protein [Candidatus Acidoferrum sp.]|nr:CHAD domain-containing protein [Candidatus Acidoferrum sp.]